MFRVEKVIRRFRGLIAEPDGVIGFRGRQLLRFRPPYEQPEEIGQLPSSWSHGVSRIGLVRRFLRQEVYHLLRTQKGTYLCASREGVLRKADDEDTFSVVACHFQGRRPISICEDATGTIYFGEYFKNPERLPVRIWASHDDGESWQVCYEYPANAIRHVHGIRWDEAAERLWVFTGDHGSESHIATASPEFTDYQILAEEGQLTRTVAGVSLGESFIYATDTPFEQNYTCSIDVKTCEITRHQELANSVFFMTKALGGVLLSTVAEPSKVNDSPFSQVWYSDDGIEWDLVQSFRRDGWNRILFQLPAIFLAEGNSNGRHAFLSCRAVKKYDNDCLVVAKA